MIQPTDRMIYDLVITLLIDEPSVNYEMVVKSLQQIELMFPEFNVYCSSDNLLAHFELEPQTAK